MTTILVIDDDPNLLENLLTLLRFEGYHPVGATNGSDGITLARQHLPALIICDIVMPEVDGYDVLRALRDTPDTRVIPLIFLTSRAARHDQRQGMASGANDYITKPFTFEEFLRAIKARLNRQDAVHEVYQQQLDTLRQAVVYALPSDLHAPLASIRDHTENLLADAATMTPRNVYRVGSSLLDVAQRLHRQIENYLLFAQLEILQLDPARVIVQRESCVSDPASVIRAAAEQASSTLSRQADLQLDLATISIQITRESLRKVAEELIGATLAASPVGVPVRIMATVEHHAYAMRISAQGATLPSAITNALNAPVRLDDQLREQVTPTLGVIVAHHLLRAHNGRLDWTITPDQVRWVARFALCERESAANGPVG